MKVNFFSFNIFMSLNNTALLIFQIHHSAHPAPILVNPLSSKSNTLCTTTRRSHFWKHGDSARATATGWQRLRRRKTTSCWRRRSPSPAIPRDRGTSVGRIWAVRAISCGFPPTRRWGIWVDTSTTPPGSRIMPVGTKTAWRLDAGEEWFGTMCRAIGGSDTFVNMLVGGEFICNYN